MYLFVYSVVFKMQFQGTSRLEYVIYVFCGLIPYIGLMEGVTSGCTAIKQNIHLIKNVMLPIELIPLRYVLISMISEVVGLVLLLGLIIWNGSVGVALIGLPFALLLEFMMLAGIVWFVAPLGVAFPDTSQFINLLLLFLMFVSPIGFRPDMVPPMFQFALYLNPVYYMIEVFRGIAINGHVVALHLFLVYVAIALTLFFAGSAFFRKFKNIMADYE